MSIYYTTEELLLMSVIDYFRECKADICKDETHKMKAPVIASNMDDLVLEVGKLNRKHRIAAGIIGDQKAHINLMHASNASLYLEYEALKVKVEKFEVLKAENRELKITESLLKNKVNKQEGEIEALKWTIKTLTERQ